MKVTLKMIKAAFGSLEKWQALATNPSNENGPRARAYCSLCRYSLEIEEKAIQNSLLKCLYCPISKLTGKKYCDNTPWEVIGVLECDNTNDQNLDDLVFSLSPYGDNSKYKMEAEKALADQFTLEYNFIAELCIYLIDRYQNGKSVTIKTAPESLKAAMGENVRDDIMLDLANSKGD